MNKSAIERAISAPSVQPAADDRSAFEAWDRKQFGHAAFFYTLDVDGKTYTQPQINGRWMTWQARSRLASPPLPDEGQEQRNPE